MFRSLSLVLLLYAFICKAQVQRNYDLYRNLNWLDGISSYGNYEAEDSNSHAVIEKAINVCSYMLKFEADSMVRSELLYHRGRLRCKKLETELSLQDLEEALALNIRNYGALERLCFLAWARLKGYTKRKTYIKESVKAWEVYLGHDSLNASDWDLMAKTYGLEGDYNLKDNKKRIIHCYQKCIDLEPLNSEYYYEYSLNVAGKEKEKMLRKALEIREFWLYRSHLISLYAYTYKNYPEALKLVDESISIYENQTPLDTTFMGTLYHFKAEIYKSMKKTDLYRINKKRSQEFYEMEQ